MNQEAQNKMENLYDFSICFQQFLLEGKPLKDFPLAQKFAEGHGDDGVFKEFCKMALDYGVYLGGENQTIQDFFYQTLELADMRAKAVTGRDSLWSDEDPSEEKKRFIGWFEYANEQLEYMIEDFADQQDKVPQVTKIFLDCMMDRYEKLFYSHPIKMLSSSRDYEAVNDFLRICALSKDASLLPLAMTRACHAMGSPVIQSSIDRLMTSSLKKTLSKAYTSCMEQEGLRTWQGIKAREWAGEKLSREMSRVNSGKSRA